MKKVIVALMIGLLSIGNLTADEAFSSYEHEIISLDESYNNDKNINEIIPSEAIRLRILANSNEAADQHLKLNVRDAVYSYIHEKVSDVRNIHDARKEIKQHLPEIKAIVAQTITASGVNESFEITFSNHVPFPEKRYGSYIYPQGIYEAVVITLGSGRGDNWWCVLFPPLCFVDFFSHEVAANDQLEADEQNDYEEQVSEDVEEDEAEEEKVEDENTEVEVRFFLLDLFNFS